MSLSTVIRGLYNATARRSNLEPSRVKFDNRHPATLRVVCVVDSDGRRVSHAMRKRGTYRSFPGRILVRNIVVIRHVGDDYTLIRAYSPDLARAHNFFLVHRDDLKIVG